MNQDLINQVLKKPSKETEGINGLLVEMGSLSTYSVKRQEREREREREWGVLSTLTSSLRKKLYEMESLVGIRSSE